VNFGGRVFGLQVAAGFRVPGVLEEAGADAPPAPRALRVVLAEAAVLDAAWPSSGAERTFELLQPDGSPVLTIDRDASAGYRVWIPSLGVCVIEPDGTRIACAPPAKGPNRWRLLLGQALPIAAALQGMEVLHASAVALDGQAVAFLASSGVGKTSLAFELIGHGARFMADDVVALERYGDVLMAHPGIGLARITTPEGEKQEVALDPPGSPVPLAAAYFLERVQEVAAIEVDPLDPPDPRLLLGATFVTHVPTAERLVTQLDICSQIARTVALFHVRSPAGGGVGPLADRIAEHASAVLQ
jgi:hypothetical protein